MCKMFLQFDLFREGLKHFQDFHSKAPPLQILFKVKFIFYFNLEVTKGGCLAGFS